MSAVEELKRKIEKKIASAAIGKDKMEIIDGALGIFNDMSLSLSSIDRKLGEINEKLDKILEVIGGDLSDIKKR